MQNKPNFRNSQMNVRQALTKDYENIPPAEKCQNKPNQTQFQPKNEPDKPNQTQFQPRNEPNKPKQSQSYLPSGLASEAFAKADSNPAAVIKTGTRLFQSRLRTLIVAHIEHEELRNLLITKELQTHIVHCHTAFS
jgi:hypothetical protein